MDAGLGELAALATAVGWGVSSQVHGMVGRMVGGTEVTLLRLPFQLAVLILLCLFLGGAPDLTAEAAGWLALSALFGIALGDLALYRGMNILGPHLCVLLQSLCSVATALLGMAFLDEPLTLQVAAGIVLTTLGVSFVVTDGAGSTIPPGLEKASGKRLVLGVGLGLVSALALACSFICLKIVLRAGIPPLWATLIRLVLALMMLWGLGLLRGWSFQAVRGVRANPKAFWMLLGSSGFSAGGMWLSSVAVKFAPTGVAATIISLQPIMVMLVGAVWYRRRPSMRAVAGGLVAFGGTALLCLR